MSKTMKNVLAVLVLMGLVIWGVYDSQKGDAEKEPPKPSAQVPVGIQQGNLAPDFELKTMEGKTMKLSDFRGKRVILNMWATWCPPCRAEMPDMEKFYEKYKDDNVAVFSVNLTQSEKDPASISAFMKEFGITFPVVLDESSQVADRYQVQSIPTSYILDTSGVIQQKMVGPMNMEMMEDLVLKLD